jgi:hypothetical protein
VNRGLAAAPTRADLYYEAALFLLKNAGFKDAAGLLESAAGKFPNEPEVALLQAISYEIAGRDETQ